MIRGKNQKDLFPKELLFNILEELEKINNGLSLYEWDMQFPIVVHSEEEYQNFINKGFGDRIFIKKHENE